MSMAGMVAGPGTGFYSLMTLGENEKSFSWLSLGSIDRAESSSLLNSRIVAPQ